MHITTVHTLLFTVKCAGNEQQAAAMAIIKSGAANMGLEAVVMAAPLLEGQDNIMRNSTIEARCDDLDKCTHYWNEISRALALVGVETTSP